MKSFFPKRFTRLPSYVTYMKHRFSSLKKLPFHLFLSCIFLLILLTLWATRFISSTDTASYHTSLLEQMENARTFDDFTNALFCYETTTDSVSTAYTLKNPAAYGIPALEPDLTSFSFEDYTRNAANQTSQHVLTLISDSLKSFSPNNLDYSDQITYSLLEKNLTLSLALCDYPFYDELLGGSTGVQASLPVTLGEYPLYTEKDINIYLQLLTQIPAYFQDVIKYEKKRNTLGYSTPDFMLDTSIQKLETILEGFEHEDNCFLDTFEERLLEVEGLSRKQIQQYQKKNEQYVKKYVVPAYKDLYAYMKTQLSEPSAPETSHNRVKRISDSTQSSTSESDHTDLQTSSTGYHPDPDTSYGLSSLPHGTDYYSLLVKSSTGSDRPVSELIAMTEEALSEALGNVLNIALTDQKAYLYYCEHSIQSYYQSPEAILEALCLMIREDYPLLKQTPGYTVKTVPDSLASSVSPAFYMIPSIDNYEHNTIYINPLYTNEENGNLFTTLAHEGFPGHMYQTVYFHDTNPDIIRHAFDYPGYVEGWATYVEMNSFTFLDYPLEGDSLCRLYQADTIISLALSSRIDMGVNYENWTLADVEELFEKHGFNSYYAEELYFYVIETPANYLSYFIGYLEILDLKEAYQKQKGTAYSEKDFHKQFLDIGPSDFETLRSYMLKKE